MLFYFIPFCFLAFVSEFSSYPGTGIPSTLQNTISMMQTLPEADLIKIQNFTKKLSKRRELETADEAVGKFLPPKSREDIYRDLETSRQQAAVLSRA